MIMANEIPQSYGKGFPLENHLRNVLVKKYLRIHKEKYGISYLGFEIEPGEIRFNNHITAGFIDIKVTNAGLSTSLICDEDSYYAIECKRLDNYSTKITAYVKEGILRFVEGKYSGKMPLAGMIGFIELGDPKDIVSKIKDKLENFTKIKTIKNFDQLELDDKFEFSYLSKHEREESDPIDICHLMFDYRSLIK